jgi:membrane protein implicated in regulation of membrane protease activity
MSQEPSPPFWIPGGIVLLIVCILVAPLQSLAARHAHSDLAHFLVSAVSWVLLVVAVAGIICIVIGLVILPLFHRRKQSEKDRHET